MAERLKRAAAWLGLVTDDRYGDYDDIDADQELTEGVQRDDLVDATPVRAGHSGRADRAGDDHAGTTNVTPLETRRSGGAVSGVRVSDGPGSGTAKAADLSRIVAIRPGTYSEARTIGEHFRDGVPVIMNLSDMEDADAKRLVDFAAGLIFGLRGSIDRVTSKVFLLSPPNVHVTAEDKERLAGGFFNQS